MNSRFSTKNEDPLLWTILFWGAKLNAFMMNVELDIHFWSFFEIRTKYKHKPIEIIQKDREKYELHKKMLLGSI